MCSWAIGVAPLVKEKVYIDSLDMVMIVKNCFDVYAGRGRIIWGIHFFVNCSIDVEI